MFNIWAVGRNYAEHAKELGHPVETGTPMIFLKAGSGCVMPGGTLHLPPWSSDIHHECELVLRFGKNLEIDALTVGLDLTARDIQNKLKEDRHPWTLAKSFKDSSAIGEFTPIQNLNLGRLELEFFLKVNGEQRQYGHTQHMLHSPEKLVSYVKERFPVVPGDLLFTGTPAGVGPLRSGDRIEAEIKNLMRASWQVA